MYIRRLLFAAVLLMSGKVDFGVEIGNGAGKPVPGHLPSWLSRQHDLA